jgi:HSP20 family molecular chaperone IbpA
LAPWRPFGDLSTLHREIDDLYSRFFGEEQRSWLQPFEIGTVPAVESFLRGGDLVVRADLPGIDPKNVELAVALPAGVDPDTVKAGYHDGVLEITMKAPKDFVSKKVPIAVH